MNSVKGLVDHNSSGNHLKVSRWWISYRIICLGLTRGPRSDDLEVFPRRRIFPARKNERREGADPRSMDVASKLWRCSDGDAEYYSCVWSLYQKHDLYLEAFEPKSFNSESEWYSKLLPNSHFRNGGIKRNWSKILTIFSANIMK